MRSQPSGGDVEQGLGRRSSPHTDQMGGQAGSMPAARAAGEAPADGLTSVPHFQDHASDNWEPEGAGSDGVVNRSWSGRRSNMLSWSTCSI